MKKKCAVCKKEIQEKNTKHLPFCSERCKLIDLGKWATGEYAIPGEKVRQEEKENGEDDVE